jgi:hypothetical protein
LELQNKLHKRHRLVFLAPSQLQTYLGNQSAITTIYSALLTVQGTTYLEIILKDHLVYSADKKEEPVCLVSQKKKTKVQMNKDLMMRRMRVVIRKKAKSNQIKGRSNIKVTIKRK